MTKKEQLEHALETMKNILRKQPRTYASEPPKKVQIFRNGHFTVAMIDGKYIGVSKFNPKDYTYTKPNTVAGARRAISRAVHQKLRMDRKEAKS